MKHTTTGTCLKGSEDPVVNLRETLWVALLFITFLKYRFYTAYADIITLESLLVYFCFLVVSRKSRYSVLELRAWTWIDNSSKFLWVKRDCGLAASKSYSFLTYYFFFALMLFHFVSEFIISHWIILFCTWGHFYTTPSSKLCYVLDIIWP